MKTPSLREESGQMVIVAIFIVIALVIGVVLVVYLNQVQGGFGAANQKRQKAHSITEAGLSYAILTLAASTGSWTNALNGDFSATGFTDQPAGTPHQYDPT